MSDVIHFTRSLLCLKWSSSTNFIYCYYVLLLVFKIIIIKLVFNDRIMRINSVVYGRWIAGWYTFLIWLQLMYLFCWWWSSYQPSFPIWDCAFWETFVMAEMSYGWMLYLSKPEMMGLLGECFFALICLQYGYVFERKFWTL